MLNCKYLTLFPVSSIRHGMNERQELYLEMSLKDIAYQIGLAHEVFYRELKKLEQADLLIRKEGWIHKVIMNMI